MWEIHEKNKSSGSKPRNKAKRNKEQRIRIRIIHLNVGTIKKCKGKC